MAQTRKNRILPLILILVCAAVMLRSAFTGLEIDEEYALSLGYRLVSGDRLFYDMWEPHQLSSLPAAALLAVFIGITGGTTGVLVFFRQLFPSAINVRNFISLIATFSHLTRMDRICSSSSS